MLNDNIEAVDHIHKSYGSVYHTNNDETRSQTDRQLAAAGHALIIPNSKLHTTPCS